MTKYVWRKICNVSLIDFLWYLQYTINMISYKKATLGKRLKFFIKEIKKKSKIKSAFLTFEKMKSSNTEYRNSLSNLVTKTFPD